MVIAQCYPTGALSPNISLGIQKLGWRFPNWRHSQKHLLGYNENIYIDRRMRRLCNIRYIWLDLRRGQDAQYIVDNEGTQCVGHQNKQSKSRTAV